MEFNYLLEKARMLNSLGRISRGSKFSPCFGADCKECPLDERNRTDSLNYHCELFEIEHPLEATEIVRKWAEEHPIKTRKDVLLEKFPNAKLNDSGIPYICSSFLGLTTQKKPFSCYSTEACIECWNAPVE